MNDIECKHCGRIIDNEEIGYHEIFDEVCLDCKINEGLGNKK